jgi:hypothetical protein
MFEFGRIAVIYPSFSLLIVYTNVFLNQQNAFPIQHKTLDYLQE